jgi:hypothetical protein
LRISARRQINGDVGRREVVTAVLQGGAARDVHLNLNDAGLDTIYRCAQGFIEYEAVNSQTGVPPEAAKFNEDGRLTALDTHNTDPVGQFTVTTVITTRDRRTRGPDRREPSSPTRVSIV